MKTIGIYTRISSADRDKKSESNSIKGQRDCINRYISDRKEFESFNKIYFTDDGFSGTTDNRPEFKNMIEKAKSKEIDVIIVRDLSRFFRDYTESGDYLECVFPFLGVRFISINDDYDSDNFIGTTGGLEIAMRNIVYSAYSKDLSNKVRVSRDIMMKQGKYGGGVPPYGYVMHPTERNKLAIDYNVSYVIEKIFNYALDGYTSGEIARKLNDENVEPLREYLKKLYPHNKRFDAITKTNISKWEYYMVARILKNQVYIGSVVSGSCRKESLFSKRKACEPIIVEDMHEPIISKDIFYKVNSNS